MAAPQSTVTYRDIPTFPGYRVGDDGSVWSSRWRGGGTDAPWRKLVIKKVNNSCGHRYVSLRVGGKSVNRLLHRLVLETFVGPCPEGMEGAHDDGDPGNNNLGNLLWKTPKENAADRKRHGTNNHGQRNGAAVLTDAQAATILARVAKGEKQRALALEYGVTFQAISKLVTRVTFRHLKRGET